MIAEKDIKVGDQIRTYWNEVVTVETIHEKGINLIVRQRSDDDFSFDVAHPYEHLFPLAHKIF